MEEEQDIKIIDGELINPKPVIKKPISRLDAKVAEDPYEVVGKSILKEKHGKPIKNIWLVLGLLWIPIALWVSTILNSVHTSFTKEVVVPICTVTQNGLPVIVSQKAEACIADRDNYGSPFVYKKVYHLKAAIPDFLGQRDVKEIVRYQGLLGEDITLLNQNVRHYGKTLESWNYMLLLVLPFLLYGAAYQSQKYVKLKAEPGQN